MARVSAIIPEPDYDEGKSSLFHAFSWTNDFRPGPETDILFEGGALEIDLGIFSIEDLCNLQRPNRSRYHIGKAPVSEYPYSAAEDHRNHATVLSTIIGGIRSLSGTSDLNIDPENETQARHSQVLGQVQSGPPLTPLFPVLGEYERWGARIWRVDPSDGLNKPSSRRYRTFYFTPDLESGRPGYVLADQVFEQDVPTNYRYPVDEIFPRLFDRKIRLSNVGTGYHNVDIVYQDFYRKRSFTERGLKFEFGYTMFMHVSSDRGLLNANGHSTGLPLYGVGGYNVVYEGFVSLNLGNSNPLPNAGDWVRMPSENEAYVTKTTTKLVWENSHPIPAGYPWDIASKKEVLVDGSIDVSITAVHGTALVHSDHLYTEIAGQEVPSELVAVVRHRIAFERWADSRLHDFWPTTFLSFSDAVSTYTSDAANFLETIPELPGMLQIPGVFIKLMVTVKKLISGKPGAVGELITTLAEAFLTVRYAVLPTQSEITEARRVATDIVEDSLLYSKKNLPNSVHGTFHTKLPDVKVPGISGELAVTTKTTIVVGSKLAQIWGLILALNNAGILPTSSRLWDLQTLSFVVDKFTGLSASFNAIDNTILGHMLPIHKMYHTISLVYTLHPDEYDPFKPIDYGHNYNPMDYKNADVVIPTLKYFARDVSAYIPSPLERGISFVNTSGWKRPLELISGASLVIVNLSGDDSKSNKSRRR
jgi:hypothetical protein